MKYSKSKLTPAKQKFAEEFAKTDNATLAVKRAYPEQAERIKAEGKSDIVLRVKANRLLTNDNVQQAITTSKNRIVQLSSRAVERLGEIIESEQESNSLKASIFVTEQAIGKARQEVDVTTSSVTLNIDLTGKGTPVIEQA